MVESGARDGGTRSHRPQPQEARLRSRAPNPLVSLPLRSRFFLALHLFREFLSAFVPFGGRQTKNRYNETFGLMKLKHIPKFLTPLPHAASCRRNTDSSALGILRRMRLYP
jgi:hypothetical protein